MKQRGAALIMALLVISIVAAIAAALIAGEQIAIKRTQFTLNADQAKLDVAYVNPWIAARLVQVDKDFNQTAKLPTWPQTLQTTLSDNSQIKIEFSPAGMRFNLNNLAQPVSNYSYIFMNMLQLADPNLSTDQAKTILQNVQNQLFGINKKKANAVTNIVSPSQLRLVTGITTPLYQALIPHLIVVPDTNLAININAAPAFVIASLLSKDQTAAAAILDYRKNNGSFANPGVFLNLPNVQTYATVTPYLAQVINVQNDKYYLAHITITRDHLQYEWYGVLQYISQTQTINTLFLGASL